MTTMINEIPYKIDKKCDKNYKGYTITEHNKKPKILMKCVIDFTKLLQTDLSSMMFIIHQWFTCN